jgi:hypothetical protein
MFSVQFAFLFLLDKAKLAGSFEKGMFYRILAKATELLVITLIPFMLAPMVLSTFRGELIFEGNCVIRGESFSVWFFAVASSGMSSVMIYLFVKPLYTNAVRMKQQNVSAANRIMKVAKRNASIAGVAVTSTFVACTIYAGLTEYALQFGKLGDHLHILGLVLTIPWDMMITGVCIRLTTTIWLPSQIVTRLNSKTSEKDSSNQTDAEATNPLSSAHLSRKLLAENPNRVENASSSRVLITPAQQ